MINNEKETFAFLPSQKKIELNEQKKYTKQNRNLKINEKSEPKKK